MTRFQIRFLHILLAFFLLTCDEEEVQTRSYPVINTIEVLSVNSTGAILQGEILNLGDGIKDYGFVYSDVNNLSLSSSESISLGETNTIGSFSILANRNLKVGVRYYARAYAIAKGNNKIVYGQQVDFLSQGGAPPEINSFTPKQAVIGDTVIIKGVGFSDVALNNLILFGDALSQVIKAKKDSIWCIVPINTKVGENKVTLKQGQITVSAGDSFFLPAITINNFSPLSLTFGDTLTINGINFSSRKDFIEATVFGKVSPIIKATATQLKIKIINDLTVAQSSVILKSGTQTIEYQGPITLLKPVITSFNPIKGMKDTQVTISGNYFNPVIANNKVEMNGMQMTVLEAAKNSLKVKIPSLRGGDYPFEITVSGQKVISTNKFEVGPIIEAVTPLEATWNEQIVIKGRGFSLIKSENIVKLGNHQCEIVSATENELIIKVPLQLLENESVLSLVVPSNNNSFQFEQPFLLKTPIITSVSPAACKSGCIVEIIGQNLYPLTDQDVYFGDFKATVLESTSTHIRAQLPTSLIDSDVTINIQAGEVNAAAPMPFHLISAWKRLSNIPQQFMNGYAFDVSNSGYVGVAINDDNSLWRYDVNQDSWSQKSANTLPGENMVSFSNTTSGWAGMSNRDKTNLQRYDVASDSWNSSEPFPGPPTALSTCFVIGDNAYVTNGQSEFFFEGLGTTYIPTTATFRYSMSSNTWTQMSNSPPAPTGSQFQVGRMSATSFAIGGDGFVFGGHGNPSDGVAYNDLLIYHSASDTWEDMGNTNVPPRHGAHSFAIDGTGYLVGGFSAPYGNNSLGDCWSFNPSTKVWTQLEDFPGQPRGGGIVFVIGSKAYFGTGYGTNEALGDFWEFDPSKL